jgi:hypothetical protein
VTWFVESPWPSLTLGLAVEATLLIVLLRTGRAKVLAAMTVVATATIAMLLVERLVVTEREEIEDALVGAAQALESNDLEAVLASFEPNSPRRGEVQSILSHVTIREARVGGDLEIHINKLTVPPSATAQFTGRAEIRDSRGQIPYEHVLRKFKVTLRRHDDRWLIHDFTDADIRVPGQGKR